MAAYTGTRIPTNRTSESQYGSLQGGVNTWRSLFGDMTPTVEARIIDFMVWGGFVDHQLSQGRKFFKHLGATAPTINYPERMSQAEVKKAAAAIDELDERLAGGLTKLTYKLFDQVLTTGAQSMEAVFNARGELVDVALVPVISIRFKMVDGKWTPFQKRTGGADVSLDIPTYWYQAFESLEGSPYGIPPFLAAGAGILKRHKAEENILFILDKFGLLGLTVAKMSVPSDYDPLNPDSVAEFNAVLEQRILQLAQNFKKGLLVTANDMDFENFNPGDGGGRGSGELYNKISDGGWGGMAPGLNSMLGDAPPRETFANVIYRFLVEQVGSFQEMTAESVKWLVKLFLATRGIDGRGVKVSYERLGAFDPQAEAQARNFDVQSELAAAKAGLISANEAAQRLYGHDADDPSKIFEAVPSFGAVG